MVQSAPVNDVTKRSTDTTMSNEEMNQRKLENNLYCAAQSLRIAGGQLRNTTYTHPPFLSPVDINNNTKRKYFITSLIYAKTLP